MRSKNLRESIDILEAANKVYVAAIFSEAGGFEPAKILGVFSSLDKAAATLTDHYGGDVDSQVDDDRVIFGDYAQAFPVPIDQVTDIDL